MFWPINEIILYILPWFNRLPTNPKIPSSDIIWFWILANIPWLDFFIDSAGAVKVRWSLDSQRLTFMGTLAQTVVSFHLSGIIFKDLCLWVVNIFLLSLKIKHFVEIGNTFKHSQEDQLICHKDKCLTCENCCFMCSLAANDVQKTSLIRSGMGLRCQINK